MSGRRFGISLGIEAHLRTAHFPEDYEGMLQDANGRELSASEARAHLQQMLAEGKTRLACSPECGNPCPNASRGCAGFDAVEHGCPGYPTD